MTGRPSAAIEAQEAEPHELSLLHRRSFGREGRTAVVSCIGERVELPSLGNRCNPLITRLDD